jgi:hypothetical protein
VILRQDWRGDGIAAGIGLRAERLDFPFGGLEIPGLALVVSIDSHAAGHLDFSAAAPVRRRAAG